MYWGICYASIVLFGIVSGKRTHSSSSEDDSSDMASESAKNILKCEFKYGGKGSGKSGSDFETYMISITAPQTIKGVVLIHMKKDKNAAWETMYQGNVKAKLAKGTPYIIDVGGTWRNAGIYRVVVKSGKNKKLMSLKYRKKGRNFKLQIKPSKEKSGKENASKENPSWSDRLKKWKDTLFLIGAIVCFLLLVCVACKCRPHS